MVRRLDVVAETHGCRAAFLTALRTVDGRNAVIVIAQLTVCKGLRECRGACSACYSRAVRIANDVILECSEIASVERSAGRSPCNSGLARRFVNLETCERHLLRLVVAHEYGRGSLLALACGVRERHGDVVHALRHGDVIRGCRSCLHRSVENLLCAGVNHVVHIARKCRSAVCLGRSHDGYLSGRGSAVKAYRDGRCGRCCCVRSGLRNSQTVEQLVVREVCHECGKSGLEVDGVESAVLIGVERSPIEGVVVLINLATLSETLL